MKKKITLKDKLAQLELENKILKAKNEAYEKSIELLGLNTRQQPYTIPYNPPLTDPNYKPYKPYDIWCQPQTFCGNDSYSYTTTSKDIIK
jgi:hypothetical protein